MTKQEILNELHQVKHALSASTQNDLDCGRKSDPILAGIRLGGLTRAVQISLDDDTLEVLSAMQLRARELHAILTDIRVQLQLDRRSKGYDEERETADLQLCGLLRGLQILCNRDPVDVPETQPPTA